MTEAGKEHRELSGLMRDYITRVFHEGLKDRRERLDHKDSTK